MKKIMTSRIFPNPINPSLVFNGLTVAVDRDRRSCGTNASSSNGLIEIESHPDLRMVKRFGEELGRKGWGRVEMWSAVERVQVSWGYEGGWMSWFDYGQV
ncbi:hypothetical protein L1987_12205 [Smallanthus sonchifolius]|uniref:Uncharacterized protein n=1 Tax=Smallanthus sonchifolius TaxID=185202 RepID=A0ACB9JDK3_9ASTR|nr:hypothetical protein L1987_12205 [Smallanthus sonchifolius]